MSRRHLPQHPAYEPRLRALTCPFCADGHKDDHRYTRVTEFEIHLETVHADVVTEAVVETWFSQAGIKKWRTRVRI